MSSVSPSVVLPEPPCPQKTMLRISSTFVLAMRGSLLLEHAWRADRKMLVHAGGGSGQAGGLPHGCSQRVFESQGSFIQSPADDAAVEADIGKGTHVFGGRHS